jgi:hypothetical protein
LTGIKDGAPRAPHSLWTSEVHIMRAHRSAKLTIVIAVAGVLAMAALPAAAAPISTAAAGLHPANTGAVEQVRWRGGGAVIGGLAAGMILGGIIASSPHYYGGPYYYYGPPPYYAPPPYYGYGPGPYGPPDWEAYCFSRYRSFDPYSGTYMGYDGLRHPCR